MRDRRKSKEKNIRKWSYGKREMAVLRYPEFLGILLAA
jgi:hypothetical protein